MSFLRGLRDDFCEEKDNKLQRMLNLSEKELLVEIILLLEEISQKSDQIQNKIAMYGN